MENMKRLMMLLSESSQDSINEMELITDYFSAYCSSVIVHEEERKEEFTKYLNLARRIERTMEKELSSDQERRFFSMGEFCGIYRFVKQLLEPLEEKVDFEKKMNYLFKKKHIPDILNYIYANSEAQHKELVSIACVGANYTSELLNELIDAECIKKTQIGKYTFYELTMNGRRFVKKQIKSEKENTYRDYYEDYLALDKIINRTNERGWVNNNNLSELNMDISKIEGNFSSLKEEIKPKRGYEFYSIKGVDSTKKLGSKYLYQIKEKAVV